MDLSTFGVLDRAPLWVPVRLFEGGVVAFAQGRSLLHKKWAERVTRIYPVTSNLSNVLSPDFFQHHKFIHAHGIQHGIASNT